jgi:steroid delta-isomerase-like uncharacterized protein
VSNAGGDDARTESIANDLALAYLEALSSGDPDRVVALVAENFHNDHASALGAGCVGRDEYRRRLPAFMASLPDLTYEPEDPIVDGDRVAVPYRLRASSDGRPVDLRGVMVIEVADGVIRSRTDYWDGLTYLRQTAATE